MNILDKIIAYKKEFLVEQKAKVSVKDLESSLLFGRQTVSLSKSLAAGERTGIIAEFKRQSPSKGVINGEAKPEIVTQQYETAGASAISVLTDIQFFGGSYDDISKARQVVNIPILRKDFMVDEYQMLEAKAMGADVILLIAAVLTPSEAKALAMQAKSLGLDVLIEIHCEEELAVVNEYVDMVGVNNRNLKTFDVDIETSVKLSEKIPSDFVKISESGISDPKNINYLKGFGFKGFLIGENFMKTNDPGGAIVEFVGELL